MTDLQEKISAYDFEAAMTRLADRKKEVQTPAGRRFHACRDMGRIRDLIDALPDSQQKKELRNLSTLLLRMILIENDGGPLSPSQLNAF